MSEQTNSSQEKTRVQYIIQNGSYLKLFQLDTSVEACQKAGVTPNERLINPNTGCIFTLIGIDQAGTPYFSFVDEGNEVTVRQKADLIKLSDFEEQQKELAKNNEKIIFPEEQGSMIIDTSDEKCAKFGFKAGETFKTFFYGNEPQRITLLGVGSLKRERYRFYVMAELENKTKPVIFNQEKIRINGKLNPHLFSLKGFAKRFINIQDPDSGFEKWVDISRATCRKFGFKVGETIVTHNGTQFFTFLGVVAEFHDGCCFQCQKSKKFITLAEEKMRDSLFVKLSDYEKEAKLLQNGKKTTTLFGFQSDITIDITDEACQKYGCRRGDVIVGTLDLRSPSSISRAIVLGATTYPFKALWVQSEDQFSAKRIEYEDLENGNRIIHESELETRYSFSPIIDKRNFILDKDADVCGAYGFQAGDNIIQPNKEIRAQVLGVARLPFGSTFLKVMLLQTDKKEITHYGPRNLREVGFILESELTALQEEK